MSSDAASSSLDRLNALNRLAASKLNSSNSSTIKSISGRRRATITKYGSSAETAQQCGRCNKTVYVAERVSVGFDAVWHKSCLRCSAPQCNRQLRAADFRKVEDLVYCGAHAVIAEKEMTNRRLGRHQSEPSILVGGILGGLEGITGLQHSQPDMEVSPTSRHDDGSYGPRTSTEADLNKNSAAASEDGARNVRRRGSSATEYSSTLSTTLSHSQSPLTSPSPEAKSPVGYASHPRGNRKRSLRIDELLSESGTGAGDNKAVSFASPVAKNGISNSPYFGKKVLKQPVVKEQQTDEEYESPYFGTKRRVAASPRESPDQKQQQHIPSNAIVAIHRDEDLSAPVVDDDLEFERTTNAALIQDLEEYETSLQDVSEERDLMEEQAKSLQRLLESNTKDSEDTMRQLEEATYELEKVFSLLVSLFLCFSASLFLCFSVCGSYIF
jgi:hypothetical protein